MACDKAIHTIILQADPKFFSFSQFRQAGVRLFFVACGEFLEGFFECIEINSAWASFSGVGDFAIGAEDEEALGEGGVGF